MSILFLGKFQTDPVESISGLKVSMSQLEATAAGECSVLSALVLLFCGVGAFDRLL